MENILITSLIHLIKNFHIRIYLINEFFLCYKNLFNLIKNFYVIRIILYLMLMNWAFASLIISIFPNRFRNMYACIWKEIVRNLHFFVPTAIGVLVISYKRRLRAIRMCLPGGQPHCVAWVLIEVVLDKKSDDTGDNRWGGHWNMGEKRRVLSRKEKKEWKKTANCVCRGVKCVWTNVLARPRWWKTGF